MDNLVCADCGTTYYSAAAATMIDRGERCDCGGQLRPVDEESEPVAVPAELVSNGVTRTGGNGHRRFERD